MHFVARSLSSAPSAILRRWSDSRDTRNEEAELKSKVWITIVIKSIESIPKDLESVEKKSGEFSQIWAVVTTCVVIVAHSFALHSGFHEAYKIHSPTNSATTPPFTFTNELIHDCNPINTETHHHQTPPLL
nr:hypothetical protein [Tanacetum cinerariifolium]